MSSALLTRTSVSPRSVLPCAGAAVVGPTPAPSPTGPVLGIAVVAAVLAAFRTGSAHPCDRQGARRAVWFPSLIFLFKDLRLLEDEAAKGTSASHSSKPRTSKVHQQVSYPVSDMGLVVQQHSHSPLCPYNLSCQVCFDQPVYPSTSFCSLTFRCSFTLTPNI